MRTITALPSVKTPIEIDSLWKDEVLEITYRVIAKHAIGIDVRCICTADSSDGTVWYDRMPRECFDTELTLVN